jgi:hypothetical protein
VGFDPIDLALRNRRASDVGSGANYAQITPTHGEFSPQQNN